MRSTETAMTQMQVLTMGTVHEHVIVKGYRLLLSLSLYLDSPTQGPEAADAV